MRIHLDTNSLIDLVQKSIPCSIDEFEEVLRIRGHKLLLSVFNILEISAPLAHKNAQTNIMTLLNRLDKLPIEFISEPKVTLLELQEALEAFRAGREFNPIQPYSERFDSAIPLWGDAPTNIFLNFGLSETVFTLWAEVPEVFNQSHSYAESLRRLFESDRGLPKKPRLSDNFVKTITLHLQLYKLKADPEELQPFANWIYKNSSRCPATRLCYDAHHQVLKNIQDIPQKGDIGDFAHVTCTPYADILTFERRMGAYVKQSCRAIGLPYQSRIFKTLNEVLPILSRVKD